MMLPMSCGWEWSKFGTQQEYSHYYPDPRGVAWSMNLCMHVLTMCTH